MPRKSDSIPINNPQLDKRVKLSDEDRANIINDYNSGLISIRGLERKYKVSRRLIQFTLFPERAERARELYAQRRKDGRYYDKEKHREDIKKHRDYKKELHSKGLLDSGGDTMKPCQECGKEQVHLLTSGELLICEDCYNDSE